MKKILPVSLFVLCFAACPAQAQLLRRPLVQEVVQSPVVHQLVDLGLSRFLGISPSTSGATSSGNTTTTTVDSSVKGSIDRSGSSLSDANDIMTALIQKYKDQLKPKPDDKPPATPTTSTSGDVTPDAATLIKKSADPVTAAAIFKEIQKLLNPDQEIAGQGRTAMLAVLQKKDTFDKNMTKGRAALVSGLFGDAVDAFKAALDSDPKNDDLLTTYLNALSLKLAKDQADQKSAGKNGGSSVVEPKSTSITMKTTLGLAKLPKSGTLDVPIQLTAAAPNDLTLEAVVLNIDPKSVKSKGTIAKGANSGTVTITTTDVPEFVTEIEIRISSPANPANEPLRLKATVSNP